MTILRVLRSIVVLVPSLLSMITLPSGRSVVYVPFLWSNKMVVPSFSTIMPTLPSLSWEIMVPSHLIVTVCPSGVTLTESPLSYSVMVVSSLHL